jgi:hypothetical protein
MILIVDAIADAALMSYRSWGKHKINVLLIAGVIVHVVRNMNRNSSNIGLTKKGLWLSQKS